MKIGIGIVIFILAFSISSCKLLTHNSDKNSSTPAPEISVNKLCGFPNQVGLVNDYGGLLTEFQRNELSEILNDYEENTSRQIAIVIVDTISPYRDIQEYAVDLGNSWGVGTLEKDNGLVIVLCKPCRQIGIATGLGTQHILTDEICNDVIINTILPEIRNDNFNVAIKKGVIELIDRWN